VKVAPICCAGAWYCARLNGRGHSRIECVPGSSGVLEYSTACWWEHVRAWARRSAGGAPSRSRHSLPVLLRVRGAAGTFVGEGGRRGRRRRGRQAPTESFSGGARLSKLVGVKDSSRRNTKVTFAKATGRRTYALEIVLEYAMMGGE
jgi:hypothetical protein